MSNLFPRRPRELFDWLPGFLQKESESSLFDDPFKFDAMRVDVKEKGNSYVIDADLPGFSKDDIVVEYRDGYLIIQGKHEKSSETRDAEENYVRRERSYGSVERRFYVGDIDEKKIEGKFKNGVLTLTVPKSREELDEGSGYRIDLK